MNEIGKRIEVSHLNASEAGNYLLAARRLYDTSAGLSNLIPTIIHNGDLKSTPIIEQSIRDAEKYNIAHIKEKMIAQLERHRAIESKLKQEIEVSGIIPEDRDEAARITDLIARDDAQVTEHDYNFLSNFLKKIEVIKENMVAAGFTEEELIQ